MDKYILNLKHLSKLNDKYDYICRLASRKFLLLEKNVSIVCEYKVDVKRIYNNISSIIGGIYNITKLNIKEIEEERKITLSYNNTTLEILLIEDYEKIDKNKVDYVMMVTFPWENDIESLKKFVYHFDKKTHFDISYTSKMIDAFSFEVVAMLNKYKNNIDTFSKKIDGYYSVFGNIRENKFNRYMDTVLRVSETIYMNELIPKDIEIIYYQNSSTIDFYIKLFSSKEPSDDFLKKEFYRYYIECLRKKYDEVSANNIKMDSSFLSRRIFIELYGIIFVSNKEIKKDKHIRYLLKKYKKQLKEPA